jgi:hypothetical protein
MCQTAEVLRRRARHAAAVPGVSTMRVAFCTGLVIGIDCQRRLNLTVPVRQRQSDNATSVVNRSPITRRI